MKKIIVLAVIAGFIVTACNIVKKKNVDYQKLAQETSSSQKLYDDLFKVLDEEAKSGDYSDTLNGKTVLVRKAVSDTCAIVTLDITGGFPMTLTVDFGTGCTAYNTGNLGTVTRKGIVQAVFSGRYDQAGTTVTITTNNYYVNDYKLEGTTVITNLGRNSSNNLEFSVENNNGEITSPGGDVTTWQSERLHEWIAGEGTNFVSNGLSGICDDVYLISGYAEGEISDGTTYRIQTEQDLRKEICCRWVTDGVLTYFVNGDELGTLDYTQTTCSNPSANFNYGNQTFVVVIQ
ncbi:MAG: hypothetical protein KDE33_18015 [Bacteroidetes bacterium]|nr:hypothetical protein [Bacteroidota bacterium]MCB9225626.1 hypothetical protein [Chitinophagales bacterium]